MSNCDWKNYEEPDANGNRRVYCINCGYVTRTSMAWEFGKIYRPCPGAPTEPHSPTIANEFPGAELKRLFAGLQITKTDGCNCDEWISRMNAWGIAGCQEHRGEILTHLNKAYKSASNLTKIQAGFAAFSQGLPLTLEGLLDEALRRAELAATRVPASPAPGASPESPH